MLNAIRLTTLTLTLSMMLACASSQSPQYAKAGEPHQDLFNSPPEHGHWMPGTGGTYAPMEAALHSLEEWAKESRKLDAHIRAFVEVLKSKPGDLAEVKRALQTMKAQSVRVQESAKQALAQVEPFVDRAKRAGIPGARHAHPVQPNEGTLIVALRKACH